MSGPMLDLAKPSGFAGMALSALHLRRDLANPSASGFPPAPMQMVFSQPPLVFNHLLRGLVGQLFDVRARGEDFFTTGNDHRADGIIFIVDIERVHYLVQELIVEGIHRLRTVEGDQANTSARFS